LVEAEEAATRWVVAVELGDTDLLFLVSLLVETLLRKVKLLLVLGLNTL
jgi:hypothetical protein